MNKHKRKIVPTHDGDWLLMWSDHKCAATPCEDDDDRSAMTDVGSFFTIGVIPRTVVEAMLEVVEK